MDAALKQPQAQPAQGYSGYRVQITLTPFLLAKHQGLWRMHGKFLKLMAGDLPPSNHLYTAYYVGLSCRVCATFSWVFSTAYCTSTFWQCFSAYMLQICALALLLSHVIASYERASPERSVACPQWLSASLRPTFNCSTFAQPLLTTLGPRMLLHTSLWVLCSCFIMDKKVGWNK